MITTEPGSKPITHNVMARHYFLFIYTIQYSTIQYNTVQYSTIQYNTVQYSTVQYSTLQYCEYNTIQNSTIQYNTIQKFIALSTHIQHFKQTNIYTIHEHTIFRGTYLTRELFDINAICRKGFNSF